MFSNRFLIVPKFGRVVANKSGTYTASSRLLHTSTPVDSLTIHGCVGVTTKNKNCEGNPLCGWALKKEHLLNWNNHTLETRPRHLSTSTIAFEQSVAPKKRQKMVSL